MSFKDNSLSNKNEHSGYADVNKIAKERHNKKKYNSYSGFANLPNQVYRRAVKKGFEFTLMVVGESGLGKSTLVNSMFQSDIYNEQDYPGPSARSKKTVAVESTKVLLKENGVSLTLTVVDTPGFGDAIDNSGCWLPILNFVENKYEEYLAAELQVHRQTIPDNRVHCCLYFIAPSGHGLKPLDVEFMQRLSEKVNIIPVIGKADTMTPEEVQLFKERIRAEIAQHKIKIYELPEPLKDEAEVENLELLKSRVPFAVVGANTMIEIDGKKVRARRYPWGIVEVENLNHCDFIALRNMIIRTHMQDLKDVTNDVHYENYRCKKMADIASDGKAQLLSNKNPLAQLYDERQAHNLKLQKMKSDMEQMFEIKVKEKLDKLKAAEFELTRMHEEREKELKVQKQEFEERRKAFDWEIKEWSDCNHIPSDDLHRRKIETATKKIASMTLRGNDESKSRGVFGTLLRRHTTFGPPSEENT